MKGLLVLEDGTTYEAEAIGRRPGALVVEIDLALRRDALAHLAGPHRPVGIDRQ